MMEYVCYMCGASDVKLWRQYQTFLSNINLLCVDCALKNQDKDYEITEDGKHFDEVLGWRSEIGWLVPAIPSGDTFWGFCAIPEDDYSWWKLLPLRTETT